jgi:hypothetical protein
MEMKIKDLDRNLKEKRRLIIWASRLPDLELMARSPGGDHFYMTKNINAFKFSLLRTGKTVVVVAMVGRKNFKATFEESRDIEGLRKLGQNYRIQKTTEDKIELLKNA